VNTFLWEHTDTTANIVSARTAWIERFRCLQRPAIMRLNAAETCRVLYLDVPKQC